MVVRWVVAALLLACPAVAGQPLIVGVVADLPGSSDAEEGIALASPTAWDVGGYLVDDGEGTYRVPDGSVLQPGQVAWLVGNAGTWEAFDGPAPRWTGLPLRLGNSGDQVLLRDRDGTVVDAFAFGDAPLAGWDGRLAASPGLVYQRLGTAPSWIDTDSPDDWRTPRPHRIGESTLDAPTFNVTRLTLYSSPDSSFQVLTDLISGARSRLHLHVYELRSQELVDALVVARTANPDLDLQVFIDGNPVGMDASERHATADALRRVEDAGGHAWLSGTGRYDHHHLKVLVADGAVAVQSENWVASGVPVDPSWGNRGWGAVVHDANVTHWFATWMAADRAAWDTTEFDLDAFDPGFVVPDRFAVRTGPYAPSPSRELTGDFRITPIVSPDHTQDPSNDPVANVAAQARRRLDAQQLDLSRQGSNILGWSGPDALLGALAEAQDRGAQVRVQYAAPFSIDDTGNAQAADWLDSRGVTTRVFSREGLATLHNKGLVADDRVVLGSMNGNHRSRSENREVGLLLEGPGVAAFYDALFETDWAARPSPRDWDAPGRDLRSLPTSPLPTLLALLGVALAIRSRP